MIFIGLATYPSKKEIILKANKTGFPDKQIAKAVNNAEDEVRARRKSGHGSRRSIHPLLSSLLT